MPPDEPHLRESISSTPLSNDDVSDFDPVKPRRIVSNLRNVLLGAFFGLFFGALTGGELAWTFESNDTFWHFAASGAALGSFGGALIGMMHRRWRSDLSRPDLATIIGGGFGAAVGIVVIVGGITVGGRKFGLFDAAACSLAYPIVGVLIGALFDRGSEAHSHGKFRQGAFFGLLGIAAILGTLWLLIEIPSGDDSVEIAREVKAAIYREWKKAPETKDAVIFDLKIARKSDRVYSGTFNAILNNRRTLHRVDVELRGERIFAEWRPTGD